MYWLSYIRPTNHVRQLTKSSPKTVLAQKLRDCELAQRLWTRRCGKFGLGVKGSFPFTKKFGKFSLEISVWEECVPFVTSSIRGSRGRPGRLRWLKTVSSIFQDIDFDGSLLTLFINWCYNHGIKKLPNHWWTLWYHFRDTIGYHGNTTTC